MSASATYGAEEINAIGGMIQLCSGYVTSACIYAAAKLGIADLLADGPKPVGELAARAGANEEALYRVLRTLSSVGVFREESSRHFANTATSATLRTGTPGSLRDAVIWLTNPMHFRVFAEFLHAVKTGGTALQKALGAEGFAYLATHPEENAEFNAAMTNLSSLFGQAIVEGYDYGSLGTLADIGGGHGALLTAILQKHPGLRGILFDSPQIVEGARARVEQLGLQSRCEIVGGDFFKEVPPAESYVMKSIIHDWDDARAIEILKNCAKAMTGDGKVLLIELALSPANEPDTGKWVDMEMLAMAGGRERTEAEYAALLEQASLKLTRVHRTLSRYCVIEAEKIKATIF
jgi:hypothetical protein